MANVDGRTVRCVLAVSACVAACTLQGESPPSPVPAVVESVDGSIQPDRAEAGVDGSMQANDADASGSDGSDAGMCVPMLAPVTNPSTMPPYAGTVFISPSLITSADPTSFVRAVYKGVGMRNVYDRRSQSFNTIMAHLMDVQFGTRKTVEFQINPEFSRAEAESEAAFYGAALGRIPGFLFAKIDTVWMHRGVERFGGGNRNILIHTGEGADLAANGWLEEVFVHESGHTSLDDVHAAAPGWIAAKGADGVALSTYARDNAATEDVAESIGPYLMVKYRASRAPTDSATVAATIPNRIRYFECAGFTMDVLQ